MKVWTVEEIVHSAIDFRDIRTTDIVGVYGSMKAARKAANKAAARRLSGVGDDNLLWRDVLGKDVEYTFISTANFTVEYIIEKRKVK